MSVDGVRVHVVLFGKVVFGVSLMTFSVVLPLCDIAFCHVGVLALSSHMTVLSVLPESSFSSYLFSYVKKKHCFSIFN